MKTRYINFAVGALVLGSSLTSCIGRNGDESVPNVAEYPGVPTLDLKPVKPSTCTGYDVQEFLISGVATSYQETKERDAEGRWFVETKDTASYKSRIVVMTPQDPAKFNGNVIVEWLNVTGGFDFSASRIMLWRELTRSGAAYVGVSVQEVGVQGGPSLMGAKLNLKKLGKGRYDQLFIPGDQYSFDIYSQVGRFLKSKKAPEVLHGLTPKNVISIGESQSAMYLTTYVNAIDPIAKVYDGYLIHSRFAFGAPLSGAAIGDFVSDKVPVKMRADLRVPTLIFTTETDVIGAPYGEFPMYGYYLARQSKLDKLAVWEVAGTAHHDSYLHKVAMVDTCCGANYKDIADAFMPTQYMFMAKLDKPFNDAPQHHYVVEAAIAALQKWVGQGIKPAEAEPLKLTGSGTEADPVRPVVDENGNAEGGVRSPWLDVPTSVLSGVPTGKSFGVMLIGCAEPFDADKLNELYPGGVEEYLSKFEKSLDRQIDAGFLLSADKDEIMEVAKLSYPIKNEPSTDEN